MSPPRQLVPTIISGAVLSGLIAALLSAVPACRAAQPDHVAEPPRAAAAAECMAVRPLVPDRAGSGTLSIRIQGSRFVDASGAAVQLRGVNFSGFEFVAVGGAHPEDPSGGQGGQPCGPDWAAIKSWRANVVRLPLNEASWLGYPCTDTSGVRRKPDPGGNYQAAVAARVAEAVAAGLYVILDLHWAAPGSACPMLQTQMADADHALAFWRSVAARFKDNPAVLFELYNEPFLDFDFSGDPWSYIMRGSDGAFSGFPATSGSYNWRNVRRPWNVASYQQMIDTVRATGATNVVLVGTLNYSADLSQWLLHRPDDPQRQMAAVWHAYPTFGAKWGSAAYAQPNHAPQVFADVLDILAADIPVLITETGDQDTPGTGSAPLLSNIMTFADQHGLGVLGWTWDVWDHPSNVLIKDAAGTPTDGYGQAFHAWLVNHAP